MRISCRKILAAVLVAVWAASAATAEGGDFAIVKNGAAVARFELGAMPNAKSKAAAEKDVDLFNKYLKMVTGAELGRADCPQSAERRAGDNAPNQNMIRIDLKPIDRLDTRYEWRICFPTPDVMRVEATTTSLFTALRQILEEGCDSRFLGAENCMFQFEPRRDVAVGVRERRNAAANYSFLRSIYRVAGHGRELGLDGDKHFEYSHGIPIYAFPAWKYGAGKWPEVIMPVIKGKKLLRPPNIDNPYAQWQPCYSNPKTAEIAVENIREILHREIKDNKPRRLSLTLGVNDINGFCECEHCKSMNAGAPCPVSTNTRSNASPSYYTFVNRVAEALEGEFPDLVIGILAYDDTIMPPDFKLHRNVVPVVTFDSGSAGMDPATKKTQDAVFGKWGETASTIGVWDYCWGWLGSWGFLVPRVNFAVQADRIKSLYAIGGRAYFGENEVADSMDGPKLYLTSRLLEDVNADPEAVLAEWFTRFAGAAAEKPLRELYRLCEEYYRSPEMKRSPVWPARNYVYWAPDRQHLFAVKPGFTEGLVALAHEVRRSAATDADRARADVLLRHMERLDCTVAFSGVAYAQPENGGLADAATAANMLGEFTGRSDELFAQWARVGRYFFEKPDFDDKTVYVRREGASRNIKSFLAEQLGRAAAFLGDAAVREALGRFAALESLPDETRSLAKGMLSDGLWNGFGGFRKVRVTTNVVSDVVTDAAGREVLRIWPARIRSEANPGDYVLRNVSNMKITQDVPPGGYLTLVTVRGTADSAKCNMVVWPQTGGANGGWENYAPTTLKAGKKHVFASVRTVTDVQDGLNVNLNMTGFKKDAVLDILDIRMLRIAPAGPSRRTGERDAAHIQPQRGSVRETVRGEEAVVCRSADAHMVAKIPVKVPRILPDEKLVFTIRAALPEGAKTGRMTAGIFEAIPGEPGRGTLVAHRGLSAKGWEDIVCSVSGASLKKKKGNFTLIVYKDKGTDAIAVSCVSWKVTP